MNSAPTKPTLGIGVLSWRAHDTLRASLDSYAQNGFLSAFDQKLIYFSDISPADRLLADQYGWEFAGGPNNGIAYGMKHLAMNLTTDYVLLLQNDNPIVEPSVFAREHLDDAVALLHSGTADLVRMRHRWQVGEGFCDAEKYARYFPAQSPDDEFSFETHKMSPKNLGDSFVKKMRRLFRPVKAHQLKGRSIFLEETPEAIFPDVIKREGNFLIVDSGVLPFSDQCVLVSRKFFLETLMDFVDNHPATTKLNGFQVPEMCLRHPWWRNKHFNIAQGRGLFTHARTDGSFRADHPAFENPESAKIRA